MHRRYAGPPLICDLFLLSCWHPSFLPPDRWLWPIEVAAAVCQQRLGLQARRDGRDGHLHAPRRVRTVKEPQGWCEARHVQVRSSRVWICAFAQIHKCCSKKINLKNCTACFFILPFLLFWLLIFLCFFFLRIRNLLIQSKRDSCSF